MGWRCCGWIMLVSSEWVVGGGEEVSKG